MNAVRFAGNDRVWMFGPGSQIAALAAGRSRRNVGAQGTWVGRQPRHARDRTADRRHVPAQLGATARASPTRSSPTPDVGYIVAALVSEVFFTTNNLASAAQQKPEDAGNAGTRRSA